MVKDIATASHGNLYDSSNSKINEQSFFDKSKKKIQLVVGYLPECNAHKVDSYNSHFEFRIQSFLPRCPSPLRGSLDLEGCKFVERDSDLKIIRHKLIFKTLSWKY